MPVLKTADLIRWSCPVNTKAGPPAKDADGSRTLVHVVDGAGNDFKIRCIADIAGFHYQYSVSFPGGISKEISTCIYDLGFNDAELVYTGTMSQSAGPTGTPIINVGSILVVEHSNEEGQGFAGAAKLKPGGADFHMVYDFAQKFRYRLNTKIGKDEKETGTSTDYLESRTMAAPHKILHADATLVPTPAHIEAAMAGDTEFRRLDDSLAMVPDTFKYQDADTDLAAIGYAFVALEERAGGILFDATLRGSSFAVTQRGLRARAPAIGHRSSSTLAVARSLFAHGGERLSLSIDAKRAKAALRATDSMIVLEFAIDEKTHALEIEEIRARAGGKKRRPR